MCTHFVRVASFFRFYLIFLNANTCTSRSKDDSLTKSTNRIISVWDERHVFDADVLSQFKSALASGSSHSQRRTRSESDLKRVPPPEAKRAKLEKQASRSSSIDEEPPNNRDPPEVSMPHTQTPTPFFSCNYCAFIQRRRRWAILCIVLYNVLCVTVTVY